MSDFLVSRVRNQPPRRDAVASRTELSPLRSGRRRLREPGVDAFGRFIGPRDLERACAHFWAAPHRRACAPTVRSDPVFSGPARAREGGAGQPRILRSQGLTLENLRALHRRHQAGVGMAQLARESGISYSTLRYHFRGSPSLRAALQSSGYQQVRPGARSVHAVEEPDQ